MRRLIECMFLLCLLAMLCEPSTSLAARHTPFPPAVISLHVIPAARAAAIFHALYPDARIRVDAAANAVVVVAPPNDIAAMRTVAAGIDVPNPTSSIVDTVQVHHAHAADVIARLRGVFHDARFTPGPNHAIIIVARPDDLDQIKDVVGVLDTVPPTPTPRPTYPTVAVRVTQRSARQIARAAARGAHNTRIAVSGSQILLTGPTDEVKSLSNLIAQLDVPQSGSSYTMVYRLRYVDAGSVADLLRRSFSNNVHLHVDTTLNAITVQAPSAIQQRMSDAIGQLDVAPSGQSSGSGAGPANADVVQLKYAIPGPNGAASTSATDIATTVEAALSGSAPDLKITVPPDSTELVLSGDPYSITQAKDLIAKLDRPIPIVVLDTEVLEVDTGTSKQLGLQFPTAAITSTYSEIAPAPNAEGTTPPLLGVQPFTRTPISIEAELNFLITTNKARVLEDPRLTTLSGHTASLRAGETINILTTTGGGTGTVATTQVQSFQTGVSLDITPIVNSGNYITINLHPSVNSLAGSSAGTGVPNIQTRDVTTSVGMYDGQTLVIGGLIEDDISRSVQKLPFLGDLPLIGSLFRDTNLQYTRNELIITVTPHILLPGENGHFSSIPMPSPEPLPTLSPGTRLPPERPVIPTPLPEPQPVNVPMPTATATPRSATETPNPLPSAFSQTDAYTYGSAPQNNYATPQQPPQIYYVQVQPTVVANGQNMVISAITSTNVSRLTFGQSALDPQVSLSRIGPGKWRATFTFSSAGVTALQGNVQMSLNAYTPLGATAALPIPLSLVNP